MLAQGVAERLAASGDEVSVLTTCARDHFTWANHYRPGRETIRGVTVHRFPVDPRGEAGDFASIQERISRGAEVSPDEEERWIRGSVHSAPLYDFIRGHRDRYGCFIFLPYLFGTTWAGSAVVPEKSLLIPCLHDEPYARLGIFRDMFSRVRGVLFNSRPERVLSARLFGTGDAQAAIAGMGFEARERLRPERFRRKFGLKIPFLLYAGRREGGKNTPLLIEYVRIFRKGNPAQPLSLALLGTGEVRIPPECAGDILDLGYVDEDLKHDGCAACLALCQPSVNESLSIVLMEAWLAGAPGLVNARCAVTSDHCTRSNGGLAFRDYYEFEECVHLLLERRGLREALAAGGRRYAEREYSWGAVLARYRRAFDRFGV
jgi:glycosyltransferase involved in cell wall biosynthesis